jgi:hypothetical protein
VGFPDWDEWQKKVECRCNIAQDEAYFYTKDIVRRDWEWLKKGWERGWKRLGVDGEGCGGDFGRMDCGNGVAGHLNKIGRHNFKIDFKPHV